MARDPYEIVLADLRAKRDEIDKLILSLEAFRPTPVAAFGMPAAAAPTSAHTVPGGRFFGASIVDASAAVLKDKGSSMGNAEIADAIQVGGLAMNSAEPANTVSSVLHRAWQNGGAVVRVGRGLWGLKEWYPGQDTSKPSASRSTEPTPPSDPPDALDSWFVREEPQGSTDEDDDDIPF